MRPSINWVVSESALSCCLAAVWRNSWVLRSVRSVLVPGYHFHPCIVLASIFFLDCPYRVVHPGFWFGILPVGDWSAYSKSTNSCSCSSPFFVVLLHSSVFSKGSVVVAVCSFECCQSVILFIHFLSYLVTERGPSKSLTTSMKNTYCLFQIKFITEYTNVQQVIITQILLKLFN